MKAKKIFVLDIEFGSLSLVNKGTVWLNFYLKEPERLEKEKTVSQLSKGKFLATQLIRFLYPPFDPSLSDLGEPDENL